MLRVCWLLYDESDTTCRTYPVDFLVLVRPKEANSVRNIVHIRVVRLVNLDISPFS